MVERVRKAAGGPNFIQIVDELGVKPSRLSRWVSRMVPLDQNDIRSLVKSLGPAVYTFPGEERTNNPLAKNGNNARHKYWRSHLL
jgi:hypothetical protein